MAVVSEDYRQTPWPGTLRVSCRCPCIPARAPRSQLTQRLDYDPDGQPLDLTYSGQVTGTDGSVNPDQVWLGWSQDHDMLGRVVGETTPAGAGFDGELATGTPNAYTRHYGYDRAGRLVHVEDRIAPAGAGAYDIQTPPAGAVCTTRDLHLRHQRQPQNSHQARRFRCGWSMTSPPTRWPRQLSRTSR